MAVSDKAINIEQTSTGFIGRFQAMASPCEVHVETLDRILAQSVIDKVAEEAWRIEHKFSRYRDDNLLYQINQHQTVKLDDEFKRLIQFAQQCNELSDGLFDITSGVLRRVWSFDGGDRVPSDDEIQKLLPFIGFKKLKFDGDFLTVPDGMEIDLGGIGKEYAVDRCLQLAREQVNAPILVNFGGDLACNGPRIVEESSLKKGKPVPWQVGIEKVGGGASAVIRLSRGALATSGDARRYLLKDGIRYSHILNPKTGQSFTSAPKSITVAANTCVEAGLFSTLAMLQGADATHFLKEQEIDYWVQE
ncbi:FAD:protein FMN transferase [Bermanella marisrubri]|uniref:FAD:protein FMN transferase n=1 Tax=Bermanella marisrubri TaxID=207949 RepID=Q1MYE9_9GAMM|nr:FAD:protein FMN transferase [Bermanella marisrubri]EAT10996.1 apbE family protein [Oceanobacter sp. RED65] [Bermanella marisrubri]QIZ83759.1 FAD:protein FMN transferase [Bermanella marisrubri]